MYYAGLISSGESQMGRQGADEARRQGPQSPGPGAGRPSAGVPRPPSNRLQAPGPCPARALSGLDPPASVAGCNRLGPADGPHRQESIAVKAATGPGRAV